MKDGYTATVKEFYNQIHHQYYDQDSHKISYYVKTIHEKLLKNLNLSTKGKLLDIGCASQKPVGNTIGCDISIEGLRIRKQQYPDNLSICADANNLPFCDNMFSGILAGLLFDHIEIPTRAFRSIFRVSKPGCHLTITVFDCNKRPPTLHRDNKLFYKSTSGDQFIVPSYEWSLEGLTSEAEHAGWKKTSTTLHETNSPGYRLIQIDFEKPDHP